MRYAASPDVTPIASVAALLRLAAPLRRCATEAADGTARSLAARCDWAAQLALVAEPSSDMCLSLAIASVGAALHVTVAQRDRIPLAALAQRVQAAVLAATTPGRPLPIPRPPLLPADVPGSTAPSRRLAYADAAAALNPHEPSTSLRGRLA